MGEDSDAPIGINYVTLLGVAPDAFVRLAAEAGCGMSQ
jgi:hypothetical protein